MPARAATSSRLAAAGPFSANTSPAAAIRAARVRSRLPPFRGWGSDTIDISLDYTRSIKYSRYILFPKALVMSVTAEPQTLAGLKPPPEKWPSFLSQLSNQGNAFEGLPLEVFQTPV